MPHALKTVIVHSPNIHDQNIFPNYQHKPIGPMLDQAMLMGGD